MPRITFPLILLVLLNQSVAFADAEAGSLLDYIRNYDLNDYALGLSVASSQSPYLDSGRSRLFYPILTSFRHASLTDNWLIIQDENWGFRYITDSDWELGVIARIQTLGLGVANSEQLLGLEDRRWSVEGGPLIGWRGLPVHIQFRSYWEAPNRHSGTSSELEFTLPWEYARGFVVPRARMTLMSGSYSDYYFGVAPQEATATIPEYHPGSTLNTSLGVTIGYELNPHWLLQAKLGVEFLDSAIEQSPLVDRSKLWSGSISLAYNPDLFAPREYSAADNEQNVEIRLGAFNSRIDTRLLLEPNEVRPGEDLDLEDFLGIADKESVAQIDAFYRVAFYHRFDLGYFELQRNSATTLQRGITFGDTFYPEGTEIETRSESRLLRLGYSYSLMRDGQKELGVSAGLSHVRYTSDVRVQDESQAPEQVRIEALLPTVGVFGSVPFGDKWRLAADVDIFVLEFDRYEGYMAYLTLDLERKFGENFGAGIGYNFYGLRLKSKNEDLDGTLRIRHQGPKVFLSVRF
jgi:hypothetical protein